MVGRRVSDVIERLVTACASSAVRTTTRSAPLLEWRFRGSTGLLNARAVSSCVQNVHDHVNTARSNRTHQTRWQRPGAGKPRTDVYRHPSQNTSRGFAAFANAPVCSAGVNDDADELSHTVDDDETQSAESKIPTQARSRHDPHDDEDGKTPRSQFHDLMQSAINAKNHNKALELFDELSTLYPEDQGANAYDMLMHLAAIAGDPDAAIDAFEASLTLHYKPSSYQHGQIILACNRAGDPQRGVEWLDMVLEANGLEWAETSKSAVKLFEKTLLGAAHDGDIALLKSQWFKLNEMSVTPDEGSLEAFMLIASIKSDSNAIEDAWNSEQFEHLELSSRSSKLMLRRVEAHARVATELIRRRGSSAPLQSALGLYLYQMRDAAAASRRAASIALDDLLSRNAEAAAFNSQMRVQKPKDVRDAVTKVINAFSVVGDSESIRSLMERASLVGVEPDHHVFNALLRSEAASRELGWVDGQSDDGEDEYGEGSTHDFRDTLDDGTAVPQAPTLAHHDESAQHAVIRVETMMRGMIESGVEPDLHSFMALLAAYGKAGDVSAAGDALRGMRERDIPLDSFAYNALLQACATSGDLDAARKVRDQMKCANVPADAVTFLHLFRACARRSRQVAAVLRDVDDWDDWDDWGVVGGVEGGGLTGAEELLSASQAASTPYQPHQTKGESLGSKAAMSHARLAGALIDARSDKDVAKFGDAARAAAAAAREGLSSITDVFSRGVEGLALSEAELALAGAGGAGKYTSSKSPELQRARDALLEFRDDMRTSGVPYTRKSATAVMQALGSLREFDSMMRFLRHPPVGVTPDAYMYTQALHVLAQDPFHWRRGDTKSEGREGDEGGKKTVTKPVRQLTGPLAALALADEMLSNGIENTRVTLNCILLACAQLRDFDEAVVRYETHIGNGGEVGADTFNCLFKAAWSSGKFAEKAGGIAELMVSTNCTPNAHTELTLRRALGATNQSVSVSGYSPDFRVANDLLIQFGFEPEIEHETAWVPMAEREGNKIDWVSEGGDSVEKKESRRWNRERDE